MARKKRRFDARAKAAFVAALEQGASVAAAARAAGFCVSTIYSARAKCALFRQAWDEAAEAGSAPVLIAPAGGRRVQKRRVRRRLFGERLKAEFLEHFAGSCNIAAAAEAAGVGRSTVNKHLLEDGDFRERFEEVLQLAYVQLEAEAVRARLEAIRRRPRLKGDREGPPADEDFDRTLQLLREHKRGRGGGPLRPGRVPGRASVEEVCKALAKRLKAFDARVKAGTAAKPPKDGEGGGGGR
jgi:transposase-like protein